MNPYAFGRTPTGIGAMGGGGGSTGMEAYMGMPETVRSGPWLQNQPWPPSPSPRPPRPWNPYEPFQPFPPFQDRQEAWDPWYHWGRRPPRPRPRPRPGPRWPPRHDPLRWYDDDDDFDSDWFDPDELDLFSDFDDDDDIDFYRPLGLGGRMGRGGLGRSGRLGGERRRRSRWDRLGDDPFGRGGMGGRGRFPRRRGEGMPYMIPPQAYD